jgi:hypothetical protein
MSLKEKGGEKIPSITRKRGNSFFAAGWGKHGPYAVVTHRIKGIGTVKATIGTKGRTIGIKRRIAGRKYEAGYNASTKTAYVKRTGRARRRR